MSCPLFLQFRYHPKRGHNPTKIILSAPSVGLAFRQPDASASGGTTQTNMSHFQPVTMTTVPPIVTINQHAAQVQHLQLLQQFEHFSLKIQ
jgi:hypothetical protein